MSHRPFVAAFALAATLQPALAQDHPPLLPTRDVAVTYHLVRGGKASPQDVRFYASAATNRVRFDGTAFGYILVDRDAGTATMVIAPLKAYVDLPHHGPMTESFLLNKDMTFTRTGSDTVAGLACTVWDVTAKRGGGTACVTDDGVILRGQGHVKTGESGGIEAVSVTYAAQPADMFNPPEGFHRLDVAKLGGKIPGVP